MWQKIQTWLQDYHLNHAAIVLLGMWPFIQLHEYIGSSVAGAAMTWSFGYFMREVMTYGRLGFWGSLLPWKWKRHDLIQTIYAVLVSIMWILIYNRGSLLPPTWTI